jgi:uncharacterized YkwD family protein
VKIIMKKIIVLLASVAMIFMAQVQAVAAVPVTKQAIGTVKAKEKVPTLAQIKAIETQVVKLVNVQRTRRGVAALTQNYSLSNLARRKAQDMIDKRYFSHYSPTYGSPFDMMKRYGFKFIAAGENIAMGQRTAQEVMNSWMNSSGHRANILNPNYTQIGVGLAIDRSGRNYWVQMFIKPLY